MKKHNLRLSQQGQGMTEYIIIVALIAIAAIGVYQAFGDVVRGQTSTAATTLAGGTGTKGRTTADQAGIMADAQGQAKTLKNFESTGK